MTTQETGPRPAAAATDDAVLREALASVPPAGVRLDELAADSKLAPFLEWCEANLDAWAEDAAKRGQTP